MESVIKVQILTGPGYDSKLHSVVRLRFRSSRLDGVTFHSHLIVQVIILKETHDIYIYIYIYIYTRRIFSFKHVWSNRTEFSCLFNLSLIGSCLRISRSIFGLNEFREAEYLHLSDTSSISQHLKTFVPLLEIPNHFNWNHFYSSHTPKAKKKKPQNFSRSLYKN